MAKGKQSKHRKQRHSKRTYGGSGASDHAIATYGDMGNQTNQQGSNVISTKQLGGKQQQQQQQQQQD